MQKVSLSHKEKVSFGAYTTNGYYGENLSIEVFFTGKYSEKTHFIVNISDTKIILKSYCRNLNNSCLNTKDNKYEGNIQNEIAKAIHEDLEKSYESSPLTKGLLEKIIIYFESKKRSIEITNNILVGN